MPVPVLYPKVSLEESSGRISRWLVAEGEAVATGQVIFEIDNDKAALEVVAPAAGMLYGLTPEGSLVDVGAEVARILAPGEAFVKETSGTTASDGQAVTVPARSASAGISIVAGTRKPNPTPLARRIARDNGVLIDSLIGSGPRGRVQRNDVLELLARQANVPTEARHGSECGELHAAWLRRGEGTPLVLIHGYSADLNSWRGFLAGFPSPTPILAVDLPGHGSSPRHVPADLDAVAKMVEDTMLGCGVKVGVLVGHSFGGAVAVRAAARGQVDARGVCLFAPAGLGPEINQAFIDGILRARSGASLRPWLQQLVHDPAVITDTFVRIVEAQREDEGLTQSMRMFAGRFMPDGTQAVSIHNDLGSLRMPVRVVFGREDRILPFHATRSLPGNVGLHAFSSCGHMPHLEYPEQSHRVLAELLRSST